MNFPAPVSFQEADDFLRSRQDTATYLNSRDIAIRWDAEARQAAFFSARVTQAAIVSRLHDVCQAVLSGEMSRAQARRLLREYFLGEGADPLAAMGFAPARRAMGLAQLASLPRLELIVYQNVKMAQERGHYQQWQKVRQDFPYGIWRVGNCANHREKHLARDGKAYAFDHPIWTQSPPGGEFNCHCYRELVSERDLKERGLSPEPLDSPFEPSSLGFDPSRPLATDPVFGRTTRPQYADQARRQCEEERARVREELERRRAEQAQLEEQARQEAERARLEQERLAREEAERLAREEAARLEQERIAKEEAARLEQERLAKEEAERQAIEEAKRLAFEAEAKRQAEDVAHKAHRQAQWQKAYEKRVATWRAQCEQTIPVAQSHSQYQDYKHCVDTLVAQYTPNVAKLGKPPTLEFYNGKSTYYSSATNIIRLGGFRPSEEWYHCDGCIHHEWGHYAYEMYYRKDPSIATDIQTAGDSDWNAFKIAFAGNMNAIKGDLKAADYFCNEIYNSIFYDAKRSVNERYVVGGIVDTIGQMSLGVYGGGHKPKYYRQQKKLGGPRIYNECIANIRSLVKTDHRAEVVKYFPSLLAILEKTGIL